MKTFLIIIGCIFLYIFGGFISFVIFLYYDRCNFGAYNAYNDMESNFVASLFWPITIWLPLGYFLYLKLKKYAIAITEILYQINHKKQKEDKNA